MMAAFVGAGCISLIFFAGSQWPHPASILIVGVVASIAGVTFARLRLAMLSARIVTNQLLALGPTMTLYELTMQQNVSGGTKLYLAAPALQAIVGSFTCQLEGERVLVLEAPSPAIPQSQTVLGGF